MIRRNLFSILPQFIRGRLAEGTDLRKIATNMGWLAFEHIFRLGVGFFIVVLIARHLGPHDFGILNYAISIAAFLGTFVYLGLGGIVVRDIVKHPGDTGVLMGSGFALKGVGACASLVTIAILAFWDQSSQVETRVLLIVGASLLVRPVEIIDLWFQSRTESKYSVLARSAAFFLASVGRLVLVMTKAPLSAFALLFSAEFVLAAIFLFAIYGYRRQTVRSWVVRTSKMISLLKESWILILSSFLALVYLKIDIIMLRWIVGPDEVGIYSVAAKFSEVWYFIPSAIAVSILPKLTEMRQKNEERYKEKLQQGFDFLFAISFSLAVVMGFIATPVITNIFGVEYERAGGILTIHIWAGVFVFMRALFSKWIIVEDVLVFSLLSHGIGAATNVALNLLLIKHYGGYGAAVATLISYAAASYFALFLASRTRPIAIMMTKAMVFPVRASLAWVTKK